VLPIADSFMRSIPVSVVIPVKNEERNLEKCLERLRGFSQIVVVDSNSTDKTIKIAESAGAEVVQFQWDGKFPKKRNWTLRNHPLRNKWVLFVDGDEYVTGEFKRELLEVLPVTENLGFWVTYQNYFMGKLLKHGEKFRKLSLFRIDAGEYERIAEDRWSDLDMEVHEHPVIEGPVGRLRAPILHEDFKGLNAYIRRHNEYSDWEARRYYAVRNSSKSRWNKLTFWQRVKYRSLDSWLFGPLYFLVSYFVKAGFLDGKEGLMFAVFKMFYFFQIKCKIVKIRKPSQSKP